MPRRWKVAESSILSFGGLTTMFGTCTTKLISSKQGHEKSPIHERLEDLLVSLVMDSTEAAEGENSAMYSLVGTVTLLMT